MYLLVSNLSPETTAKTLQSLFNYYGQVTHVNLVLDGRGRSKGMAVVEMTQEEELDVVIEKLDGLLLDGNAIYIDKEEGEYRGPG